MLLTLASMISWCELLTVFSTSHLFDIEQGDQSLFMRARTVCDNSFDQRKVLPMQGVVPASSFISATSVLHLSMRS